MIGTVHDAAHGIGHQDLDLALGRLLEVFAGAADGAAGGSARDEVRHLAAGLLPNLGAEGLVVRVGVVRVLVLVHGEVRGVTLAQRGLEVDVVLGMVRGEAVLGDDELTAVRGHAVSLLLRALGVGDGDVAVAADSGDHGDGRAGVAGGGRDEGIAGFQATVALGAVDDVLRDAILDRSGGVEVLRLGEDFHAFRLGESAQVQQGRVADDRGGAGFLLVAIARELRRDGTHDARSRAVSGWAGALVD